MGEKEDFTSFRNSAAWKSAMERRSDDLYADVVYALSAVVSPGHSPVLTFFIPEDAVSLDYALLTVYFPGLEISDYPLNSSILYLPAISHGSPFYMDGAFSEFEEYGRIEAGTGVGGGHYYWDRAFVQFSISPIMGFLLTTAELQWVLALKRFAGAGANAQKPMILDAIPAYGTLDAADWAAAAEVSYGNVNLFSDADGIVYTKDVKTRLQAQADAKATYSAFRFKTDTEPADVVNANNYHLGGPQLYCVLSEDRSSRIGISFNNGSGFGSPQTFLSADKEEIPVDSYFEGPGKKRIKFTSDRNRRIDVILRLGLRQG